MVDRRTWKTGVLALVGTGIFGIFIFRVPQWSRTLDSKFLVHERTDVDGDSATSTRIVPQVVVGSYDGGLTKYSTTIQIVNTGGLPVNVSAAFFNQDGTPSTLAMQSGGDSFTGSLPSTSVEPNAAL